MQDQVMVFDGFIPNEVFNSKMIGASPKTLLLAKGRIKGSVLPMPFEPPGPYTGPLYISKLTQWRGTWGTGFEFQPEADYLYEVHQWLVPIPNGRRTHSVYSDLEVQCLMRSIWGISLTEAMPMLIEDSCTLESHPWCCMVLQGRSEWKYLTNNFMDQIPVEWLLNGKVKQVTSDVWPVILQIPEKLSSPPLPVLSASPAMSHVMSKETALSRLSLHLVNLCQSPIIQDWHIYAYSTINLLFIKYLISRNQEAKIWVFKFTFIILAKKVPSLSRTHPENQWL